MRSDSKSRCSEDRQRAIHLGTRAARLGLAVLIGLALAASNAAAWEQIWGQDAARPEVGTHIAVDAAGRVYVAAWTETTQGDHDWVVLKYAADGTLQWKRTYDSGLANPLGSDKPAGIAVDSTGAVIVTGRARFARGGLQDYDYITIKWDAAGDLQWQARYQYMDGRSYADDIPRDLILDGSNNVIVTGESASCFLTVKYDADGTEQWTQRWNDSNIAGVHNARAVDVDSTGNIYVTGESMNASGVYEVALVKYSPTGAQGWSQRYSVGGALRSEPADLVVDGSGNALITGYRSGTSGLQPRDILVLKYTTSGSLAWADTYSGTGDTGIYDDDGTAVAVDGAGNVYVAGSAHFTDHSQDLVALAYQADGTRSWVRTYNQVTNPSPTGESFDSAHDIAVDGLGTVWVAGTVHVDNTIWIEEQVVILGYTATTGALTTVSLHDADPSLPQDDRGLALDVTPGGTVALTGAASVPQTVHFDDIYTICLPGVDGLIFADGFEPGNTTAWSATVGGP